MQNYAAPTHIEPEAFLCLEGPSVKTTIRRCIGKYNDAKSSLGGVLAYVDADQSPYPDGHSVFCLLIKANESRKYIMASYLSELKKLGDSIGGVGIFSFPIRMRRVGGSYTSRRCITIYCNLTSVSWRWV